MHEARYDTSLKRMFEYYMILEKIQLISITHKITPGKITIILQCFLCLIVKDILNKNIIISL